MKEKENKTVN